MILGQKGASFNTPLIFKGLLDRSLMMTSQQVVDVFFAGHLIRAATELMQSFIYLARVLKGVNRACLFLLYGIMYAQVSFSLCILFFQAKS